jgi:hypothetical protein
MPVPGGFDSHAFPPMTCWSPCAKKLIHTVQDMLDCCAITDVFMLSMVALASEHSAMFVSRSVGDECCSKIVRFSIG